MNSSENSLQSAFLRFKERKKKLLQQAQAEEETRHRHSLLQDYDSLSPLDLRRRFFDCDEEERARRNTLRIKFVEHAKKYIGVPYARRYHAPDRDRSNDRFPCAGCAKASVRSPCAYFDAPLHLDCCGLIRRVLFDLREDFGFTIGKWNQAYYDRVGRPDVCSTWTTTGSSPDNTTYIDIISVRSNLGWPACAR
eukprot:Rmarinus@m.9251